MSNKMMLSRPVFVVLLLVMCVVLAAPSSPACDDFTVSKAGLSYMLASLLAGGSGNVPEFTDTPTFPDVPSDFWAFKYVEYAVDQGVFAGEGGQNFAPKSSLARGSTAKYLARALVAPMGDDALPTPPATSTFVDVPTDHPDYRYVEYLHTQGIPIACGSPDHFCPDDATSAFTAWSWFQAAFLTWTAPDDPCTIPPTAEFTGPPASGAAPLLVQFLDASIDNPMSWLWDFGDGATSIEQNPAHTYQSPGIYTVSLTVANDAGQSTFTSGSRILVTYPDVPLDFWALGAILGCSDAGIVYGYEDGLIIRNTL